MRRYGRNASWALIELTELLRKKGKIPIEEWGEEEKLFLDQLIWNLKPSEVLILRRICINVLMEKKREGLSMREIAEITGYSILTVRKYLRI